MNLLTSARLYEDQLASHLSACLPGENDIKERAKMLFTTEHDNHFEYRFMEALRNHVQHSDTAVHGVTRGSRWTALDEDGLLEFSASFSTNKELLLADGHFKKQVLEEMPGEVDLGLASRCYVECISAIHSHARDLIRAPVNDARASIQDAINEYSTVCKKPFVGLYAYGFSGDEKTSEVAIFLDWDNIRIRLENRNIQLVNLKKRYITGKVQGDR